MFSNRNGTMERYFLPRAKTWKTVRQTTNQDVAHAHKRVKAPLKVSQFSFLVILPLLRHFTAYIGSCRAIFPFRIGSCSSFINIFPTFLMAKSCARSQHHPGDSELSHSSNPPKRPRTTTEDQIFLTTILKALQDVQKNLKSTKGRVSIVANYWHWSMPVYPLKSRVETDALSVLVYSDDDVLSNQNHLLLQGQLGAHALG